MNQKCVHSIDYLNEVFSKPDLLKQLITVAERQKCLEYIQFLQEYSEPIKGDDHDREQAAYLYNKYIGVNAIDELNLDFSIKDLLTKAKDTKTLRMQHFSKVAKVVKELLVENPLKAMVKEQQTSTSSDSSLFGLRRKRSSSFNRLKRNVS